jgi:hypothetical protein
VKFPSNSLLSLSGSDISFEVRGDSGCGSCIASYIDCRDNEDVSVLLPPSPPNACATCNCDVDCAVGVDGPKPEFPVINNLLKASTSIDARPGLGTGVFWPIPGPLRCVCSIVSNVLENGFAGALPGLACLPSSSSEADSKLSNGSGSRSGGVEGCAERK